MFVAKCIGVDRIVLKAHQRSNIIHRCFVSRNVDLLVRAFITYVRPLLEYNSVTWSPHLKYDIERIEKVQRRFTKRLHGFSGLSYNDRLKQLNINSLEHRRLYFDLLWCYKLLFGLVRVNRDDFFSHYDPLPLEATLIRFLNIFAIAPLDPTFLLNAS